ncbi:MAG TPA: HPr family phosphocarrier protein [Bacillales bacterium]|nr:HPr family phosphocarrier protein [Bacillales bacterium]
MVVFHLNIDVPNGLHLRPASRIITIIKNRQSSVKMKYNEEEVRVSELSHLLKMGINEGGTITLTVDGPDEEETAEAIIRCMKK